MTIYRAQDKNILCSSGDVEMVCWTTDQECCSKSDTLNFFPQTMTVECLCPHLVQGIGGNICNASPISDLNPTLLAAGVKLTMATKGLLALNPPSHLHLVGRPSCLGELASIKVFNVSSTNLLSPYHSYR